MEIQRRKRNDIALWMSFCTSRLLSAAETSASDILGCCSYRTFGRCPHCRSLFLRADIQRQMISSSILSVHFSVLSVSVPQRIFGVGREEFDLDFKA